MLTFVSEVFSLCSVLFSYYPSSEMVSLLAYLEKRKEILQIEVSIIKPWIKLISNLGGWCIFLRVLPLIIEPSWLHLVAKISVQTCKKTQLGKVVL